MTAAVVAAILSIVVALDLVRRSRRPRRVRVAKPRRSLR